MGAVAVYARIRKPMDMENMRRRKEGRKEEGLAIYTQEIPMS